MASKAEETKKDEAKKEEAKKEPLRVQVLEKMSALMTAAFGLVAALAWNDAVKLTIDRYYAETGGLGQRYVYALAVTTVAVLVSLWIGWGIGRLRGGLTKEQAIQAG